VLLIPRSQVPLFLVDRSRCTHHRAKVVRTVERWARSEPTRPTRSEPTRPTRSEPTRPARSEPIGCTD